MSKQSSTEGSGESLESKAGRLLFVGLPVTKLDRHWREFLREVRPGGVILFGRNVESAEQVALLNAQIRDAAGREVLIGVDQEGGLVDRFRDIIEPMPSAKAVRNAGRVDLAEKFGTLSARALRLMGFNINFAPVLDLSGENDENGLRARTFGQNSETVSMLAGAYLEGLQRGQVIGCGKHFPGLGGSKVDSHRNLPVVTHTWQEIFQRDLVPFMDLMFHRPGERLRTVMVSHAAFPDISEFLQDLFRQEGDPPTIQGLHEFPATISGNVTTRLLRLILKFDGLVITDDMEMGAVVQTLTVPEACLRAIEAGSDMVLICEREENVLASRDELARAVREKRLSTRALAAVERRMSWALKLAGEPEAFDADEFKTVSLQLAQLKQDLKTAEETGEYSPLFGTADGGTRRSSNF
jgi:beta-N-acetylhexosaminidase